MAQQRYIGVLKKWNTERGFGFIAVDDGGQEIFTHITAFARNSLPPTMGERLSFEVESDRNGKRSAVRVRRPGEEAAKATHRKAQGSETRVPSKSGNLMGSLIGLLLVGGVAWLGYSQYAARAAVHGVALPAPPAALSPAKLTVPSDFRCDGRNTCSQMTSCREATLFLQNCQGMQLDGNGDGVPCEQQWCK
jgi:cold shock CspA family protein